MRPQIRILAAVAAAAVLAAGCGRASSPGTPTTAKSGAKTVTANFGTLSRVCHGGNASGAPEQGVNSSQVEVGVMTDEQYTHDPTLVTAAHVFTDWCNAAGGIDGRQLVADIHQTDLLDSVGAMAAACSADFATVGGSAALDGIAVDTRLKCLLPDFPAQTVMPQNTDSALQAYPLTDGYSYAPYAGYFTWLMKQAYPGSAAHVGILYGNSPITLALAVQEGEALTGVGGTEVYTGEFPVSASGAVTDWTPYAEAIKSKGVKGLVFYGTPQWLAALELDLTNMNYKLDWIDANTNSYGPAFIQVGGKSLSYQHNYADIDGYYPVEKASSNPATAEMVSLYAKYAPGQKLTLQAMQAFSAWLLFASSAETCGSNLTRRCVYDAAISQTAWTGGGLQSPVNLATPDSPVNCWNAEMATPTGWVPAPFDPNTGAYRCGAPVYKLPKVLALPETLADVGESMSNFR